MGKASAPPPPDYTPVAASSLEAAQLQQGVAMKQLDQGQQQLQWSKDQYADMAPYTKAVLTSDQQAQQQQMDAATKDRARYEGTYQPVEDKFVQQAQGWNTPARAGQQAAQAQADVASQFEQARRSATANLESFGIDPSATRFGALDLGTRVSQAAAMAGAGTQSRINTEAAGLGLMGEAINIGKGYPGQVSQAYAGATQAGQAGVTGGLNTSSTYGNLMGSPVQYGSLANSGMAGATGARNTAVGALQGLGSYNIGATQIQAQENTSTGQGIGTMVGLAAGAVAI